MKRELLLLDTFIKKNNLRLGVIEIGTDLQGVVKIASSNKIVKFQFNSTYELLKQMKILSIIEPSLYKDTRIILERYGNKNNFTPSIFKILNI